MPAALIGPAIGAAGSIAGGIAGGKGARRAARIAAETADKNRAAGQQFLNDTRELYQPEMTTGNNAMNARNALLGLGGDAQAQEQAFARFQNASGFRNQLNEGLQAVNTNAYARGLGDSGATLRALQDRGNDLAQRSFGQYFGMLGDQQNVGVGAKAQITDAGQTFLNSMTNANNQQGSGAITAATRQGNIWGNVFGQLGQLGNNYFTEEQSRRASSAGIAPGSNSSSFQPRGDIGIMRG